MLKRLYIHNYKAFQNFEIKFDDLDSMLCLGKNGAGKSSLVEVFHIFQKIGEGKSQLSDLIDKSCFNFINNDLPMQLELEVELQNEQIKYLLLLDFPNDFNACRVIKERLTV
ncbi:TPA: AAA family ATPase, partial [Haemophilus influenzae]